MAVAPRFARFHHRGLDLEDAAIVEAKEYAER